MTASLQRTAKPGTVPDRRAAFQSWTTPLWSHALPAWSGNARVVDLMGHAELAERHDAVRRWRGLGDKSE